MQDIEHHDWQLSFTLSEEEMRAAAKLHRAAPDSTGKTALRIVVLVVIGVLALIPLLMFMPVLVSGLPEGTFGFFMGALACASLPLLLGITFGLAFNVFGGPARSAADYRRQTMTCWVDRFVIASGNGEIVYYWRDIKAVRENDRLFLLVVDDAIAFSIPKRALPDAPAIADFREYLTGRTTAHIHAFPVLLNSPIPAQPVIAGTPALRVPPVIQPPQDTPPAERR